jgi:transcriptional regulator with XRE-family HTH domain
MNGIQLLLGRRKKGWSQQKAAARLGVSQPYLSLLEKGERAVTEELAHKAAHVFGLSPAALPMKVAPQSLRSTNEDELATDLAALGYPGLSHFESSLRRRRLRKRNPAEVLASALQVRDLDSRLTEALPWVLVRFPELNWHWLVSAAKLNDLQNRLGFVTNVARRLAERSGESEKAASLAQQESVLERSRLAREDTLCHQSLTKAERRWLRGHRSREAKHWRLLTDLSPEHLSYAVDDETRA